jgi:uncharacterized membrane protein
MLLIFHITAAVLSLLYSMFAAYKPENYKTSIVYILLAIVGMSGVVLTAVTPATFGKMCISGALYLIVISVLAAVSKYRISSVSA